MRHLKKKRILDRKIGPRRALYKGLISQLIIYEKIKTTEAKAKAIKPLAEKLITRAGQDNLANRRYLYDYLPIKKSVKKIFEVLAPKYKSRPGGYLKITKLGTRRGDRASLVQIEFVK